MRFPPVSERFERLEEALQICMQMWSDDDGPFEGRHYQLNETICDPRPISQPRPPVMIGGSGERKTLRLVARYADACNLFAVDPATVAHKLDVLRRHCDTEERDYDTIRKTVLAMGDPFADMDAFVDQMRVYAELGIDTVIFMPSGDPVAYTKRLGTDIAGRLDAVNHACDAGSAKRLDLEVVLEPEPVSSRLPAGEARRHVRTVTRRSEPVNPRDRRVTAALGVDQLGDVVGEPEPVECIAVERQDHHRTARHVTKLAETAHVVGPLMHGDDRHRGVEGRIVERQRLGGSIDRRCAMLRPLRSHRGRRLNGQHMTVLGLVRTGPGADVEDGRASPSARWINTAIRGSARRRDE